MKKTLFAAIALMLIGTMAHAQLANTRWTGSINAPDPLPVIMLFKSDTLIVHVANDPTAIVETMKFSEKDGKMTINKLGGSSPCSETTAGTYSVVVVNDGLTIKPLTDDCAERAAAFPPEPFKRVK